MPYAWSSVLDRGHSTNEVVLNKGHVSTYLDLGAKIEGAFVWHRTGVKKLLATNKKGVLLALIKYNCGDRVLGVLLDNKTSTQQAISAFVPQGSPLGPLKWSPDINDLLDLVSEVQDFARRLDILCKLRWPK